MGKAVLLGIVTDNWYENKEEEKDKCASRSSAVYVPYLMDWILETMKINQE